MITNTKWYKYYDSVGLRHVKILVPCVLLGSEMESKWITWRIVYLVTLVQVVLLNAYYGACMVSDLLQPPPRTILTVKDLINSKLHVGYVDNSHNREYFQVDITGIQNYKHNLKWFGTYDNKIKLKLIWRQYYEDVLDNIQFEYVDIPSHGQ